MRWALKNKKPIILIHETDDRHGKFDFGAEREAAPEDLQSLLTNIESLPWRRRKFERNAVFSEMEKRAKNAVESSYSKGSFCPSQHHQLQSQNM